MDLLIEKGDKRTYLSRYKVITTSFEESSPSVKRNNTQIQYRNGNVDFGGWHEAKKIDYVGYYRADDIDEEEVLREKIYALLSDQDGYYITQLKNDSDNSYERPGENTGDYFEKQVNRPSHKRFYVYASSLESELVGSYGGHVLYKISATFTTMKLPYGESVPRDLDVKPNVPYIGDNLYTDTKNFDNLESWYTSNYWTKNTDTYKGLAVLQTTANWKGLSQYIQVKKGDILTYSVYAKNISGTGNSNIYWALSTSPEGSYSSATSSPTNSTVAITDSWQRVSGTTVATSDGYLRPRLERSDGNTNTLQVSGIKVEKGSVPTPYSPAPSDAEYNAWYTKFYYNTDNLVIPYAGTVPCNQLEQGFTIEFTAKEGGSGLKVNLNGTELTYSGQVYSGDVVKLSGYEYTKNDISIVELTNKAYFKLIPGITNEISSNLHGSIKILGFQDLYA